MTYLVRFFIGGKIILERYDASKLLEYMIR